MLIINVVFSLFLSPVQLLKYRIKNKKGSPWVTKKVVFGFYYIISLVSREAPEGHHWSRVVGMTPGAGWSRERVAGSFRPHENPDWYSWPRPYLVRLLLVLPGGRAPQEISLGTSPP